jgi:hypothetical protein
MLKDRFAGQEGENLLDEWLSKAAALPSGCQNYGCILRHSDPTSFDIHGMFKILARVLVGFNACLL